MANKNKSRPGDAPANDKKGKNGSRLSRSIANPVRNLIVTTVVSFLIGLAFFIKPYEITLYLGYGVGGLLALVGIIYILIYFMRRPVSGVYRSEFVIGLVALLAGAYIALSGITKTNTGYNMNTTANSGVGYILLIRVIGILIVADGLLKLQYAVDLGRMRFRAWWIVLILAAVSIAIGVGTAMNFVKSTGYGMNMNSSSSSPDSYIYYLGGQLRIGANNPSYRNNVTFYGGMLALGIGFMLNGALDLASLIIIAIRNHKAARADAIEEASFMIASAKKDEVALPPEQHWASPEPAEEVVIPMQEPASAPSAESRPPAAPPAPAAPAAQASALNAEAAVFEPSAEPKLENPVLATPVDE